MKVFNTVTAAEELSCCPATITRWADRLNIGQKMGASRIFSKAEIERIRKKKREKSGRPEKNEKK